MFIQNLEVVPKYRDRRRAVSRRDAALLIDDVVDARRGHPQRHRQLVRRHAERRQELLTEDFSRMNGWKPILISHYHKYYTR